MQEIIDVERIAHCRVCNSPLSENIIDLKAQSLTGIFAKDGGSIPSCNMSLSMCTDASCGLVQINEIYDMSLLYGDHYGYASSLNASMVEHLQGKANALKNKVALSSGDVVIDIGSNDATTLSFFSNEQMRIGVDATGVKFKDKYEEIGAILVPEFFPTPLLHSQLNGKKAKIISSYSCFYDLPDPVGFAKGIAESLDQEGVWCLEQSYLPLMLETNSFDTICHEHIEYYRLVDIHNICERANLKILSVEFNDVNGGSFSVMVGHKTSKHEVSPEVLEILQKERNTDWQREFKEFNSRIEQCKNDLIDLLVRLKGEGKRVVGLGASTKGNVLLQYYGLNSDLIEVIGEVNSDKFGCQTPGSAIPIITEDDLLSENPDYILVLPWHFRKFFLSLASLKGRKLIFPLPTIEVITA